MMLCLGDRFTTLFKTAITMCQRPLETELNTADWTLTRGLYGQYADEANMSAVVNTIPGKGGPKSIASVTNRCFANGLLVVALMSGYLLRNGALTRTRQ
jgi:hypothetical protein